MFRFQKIFRFSENFQIFAKFSKFRKIFRFLKIFSSSDSWKYFRFSVKIFRCSENFQILCTWIHFFCGDVPNSEFPSPQKDVFARVECCHTGQQLNWSQLSSESIYFKQWIMHIDNINYVQMFRREHWDIFIYWSHLRKKRKLIGFLVNIYSSEICWTFILLMGFILTTYLLRCWCGKVRSQDTKRKHRKNCVCCPRHSLFKGHKVTVNIVVCNCRQCNQCQVSGHKLFKKSENFSKNL